MLWVEFKYRPQTCYDLIGMGIDTVDEGFASIEEVTHGLMAVVARDRFSHPAPEIPNQIEVGTMGRQRDVSETEFGGGSLNGLGPIPGGADPDDHDCARLIIQPCAARTESCVLCYNCPRSR